MYKILNFMRITSKTFSRWFADWKNRGISPKSRVLVHPVQRELLRPRYGIAGACWGGRGEVLSVARSFTAGVS